MISPKLKTAILNQLKLDDFDLRDETTADQVPGWDSLSHVQILAAVETAFGVRFRGLEIIRLKNIGDLQSLIDKKVS